MTRRKRRKAGKRSTQPLPGWIYLLFGLVVGVVIAYIYYEGLARPLPAVVTPAPVIAPPAPEPRPELPAKEDTGITFDFYEMLPELDVEVFADDPAPAPRQTGSSTRITDAAPGIYILQAGSFSQLADAKRREGEIALLGISAEIKKGDANGRTVYRVYTQPLESSAEVNRMTGLLNDNNIETLPKRVK